MAPPVKRPPPEEAPELCANGSAGGCAARDVQCTRTDIMIYCL